MRAPIQSSIPYDYTGMFQTMEVHNQGQIIAVADQIVNNFSRYKIVEQATDVPAAVIACLHYRESSLKFTKHLYNGDPLTRRTVNEPAGRPVQEPINGKVYTWEESAADALKYDGAKRGTGIDLVPGWSINEMLYFFEKYNGFGYRKYHDTTSPYLWSCTQYYTMGKYDKDGHYNPGLKDGQIGCAPLLAAITEKAAGWI